MGPLFPNKARARARPAPKRFHAVTVKCGKLACAEAQQLASMRFLSSEAPPLPLPGCNAPGCTCRYAHHDDRRDDENRRDQHAVSPAVTLQRRVLEDRRSHPSRFVDRRW